MMESGSKSNMPAFFILAQYICALLIIIFFSPVFSGTLAFVVNLLFYLAIFFIPIFIFIKSFYKQKTLHFIQLSLNKIQYGIIASAALSLIFCASHGFRFDIQASGLALALTITGAALAGLFEETVFRGFYLNVLSNKFGFISGNIISSAAFAALHFRQIESFGFVQIIILFVLSLFIGFFYKETKSLTNAVLVHASFNIMVILF